MEASSLRFARRFDKVSGSAIREIFKVIAQPGMISFAGGNPSPSALPDDVVSELAVQVLADNGKAILQYGATEGYAPFVESLKTYVRGQLGTDIPAVLPQVIGEGGHLRRPDAALPHEVLVVEDDVRCVERRDLSLFEN